MCIHDVYRKSLTNYKQTLLNYTSVIIFISLIFGDCFFSSEIPRNSNFQNSSATCEKIPNLSNLTNIEVSVREDTRYEMNTTHSSKHYYFRQKSIYIKYIHSVEL